MAEVSHWAAHLPLHDDGLEGQREETPKDEEEIDRDLNDWIIASIVRSRTRRSSSELEGTAGQFEGGALPDSLASLEFLVQWRPPKDEWEDYPKRSDAQYWHAFFDDDEEDSASEHDEQQSEFALGPRGRALIQRFLARRESKKDESARARRLALDEKSVRGAFNRAQREWNMGRQKFGLVDVAALEFAPRIHNSTREFPSMGGWDRSAQIEGDIDLPYIALENFGQVVSSRAPPSKPQRRDPMNVRSSCLATDPFAELSEPSFVVLAMEVSNLYAPQVGSDVILCEMDEEGKIVEVARDSTVEGVVDDVAIRKGRVVAIDRMGWIRIYSVTDCLAAAPREGRGSANLADYCRVVDAHYSGGYAVGARVVFVADEVVVSCFSDVMCVWNVARKNIGKEWAARSADPLLRDRDRARKDAMLTFSLPAQAVSLCPLQHHKLLVGLGRHTLAVDWHTGDVGWQLNLFDAQLERGIWAVGNTLVFQRVERGFRSSLVALPLSSEDTKPDAKAQVTVGSEETPAQVVSGSNGLLVLEPDGLLRHLDDESLGAGATHNMSPIRVTVQSRMCFTSRGAVVVFSPDANHQIFTAWPEMVAAKAARKR
jgi:hypothetical protein